VVTKDRAGDIFVRQTESIRFHVSRDEVRWADRFNKPEGTKAAVIDFGCGVQFVPHLMIETMAVCERLGIDAAGVVGPEYCCGQPYREGTGTSDSAESMADASYKRMAALQPLQMVQWCGAAFVQFKKRADVSSPGTEIVHIPALLARRVAELGERAPWKKRIDARVLIHKKPNDPMPFVDRGPVMRSYDHVPEMLGRIPGFEIVGEIRDLPSTLPCEKNLDTFDEDALRTAREELAAKAREAGADRIVCDHHQCFRQWAKLATDDIPVQQYISVLAEALGVGQPDRYHAHWHAADPVADARPQWSSWGMSEDEATELAARLYPRR